MGAHAVTPHRARRRLFVLLGVACTGLAAIGVVVPGMPTTVFLIAASWLFSRSAPALEQRLHRNRWFGPALRRFAETGGMPRRAKAAALASMWAGIALSIGALAGHPVALAGTVTLGLAGTATLLFRVPTTLPAAVPVLAGVAAQAPPSRAARS